MASRWLDRSAKDKVAELSRELEMTKAQLEMAGGNDLKLAKEMQEKLAAERESCWPGARSRRA